MVSSTPSRICPQCETRSPAEHHYCPACGFPIATVSDQSGDAFVGQTLQGGYHILDLISVGGMGRVYRAEQSVLGRTVAVKVIHPHLLADENAALRFLTEARAASQLNHPNSIAVYDFGRTPHGQPYLIMEFLRGKDLARVVYEEGLLPFARIVNVLTQVLSALFEAHALGIVHRDLKPENVVLEPLRRGGDFVKVLDFGLAKLRTDTQFPTNVTSPGIVCGTPDYMAPEQGRGDPIDGRSDLYAVGVMLFQLLTGRLPFEADSPTQVVMMHLSVTPPDPREIAPDRNIPDAFVDVVFKALSKEADQRYQDAQEFADALRAALEMAQTRPPPGRSLPNSVPSVGELPSLACPRCGLMVPAGRFCLECGARLTSESNPPIRASEVQLPLVLLAREEDWDWLLECQQSAQKELVAARILGEVGAGKTRLLHDYLRHAENTGAMVVITGPDPDWAEVPCFALKDAIEQMVVVDLQSLGQNHRSSMDEATLRGLSEILGQSDAALDSLSPAEKRHARVCALRWALRHAHDQFNPEVIILAVDDLNRIDTPSQMAIRDLVGEYLELPVLVLGAHPVTFDPQWSTRHPCRYLKGIPLESAKRLLRATRAEAPATGLPGPEVLPLLLDQLLRYAQDGGTDPAGRLADLFSQRLDVLPPAARHALQALAVLGDRVDASLVAELTPPSDDVQEAIRLLEQRGMVWTSGSELSVDHPLLREVVLAAIPAQVRRELHAQALAVANRRQTPLEARAQLAYLAEDSFHALLLLERVAEAAAQRGDVAVEILALRRGLDLARREIARGELDDPMRAVIIFSRKLGAALTRAGSYSDAEGILREALDYATPTSSERARLLGALAHVARGRERNAEALHCIEQAIDAAQNCGAADLVAVFNNTRSAWSG